MPTGDQGQRSGGGLQLRGGEEFREAADFSDKKNLNGK